MSKPLPWHDTPRCRAKFYSIGPDSPSAMDGVCGGPIVSAKELGGSGYYCGACGEKFRPNADERVQIERAETAWEAVLRGEVHEDRGCAKCGGVLPIDRFRLCASCVERDNAERQIPLFTP